jgi:lysophospholipase L1-like esterase
MPLGASVTFGTGSTTGDSYRKNLLDQLVAAGQTVNYVGEFQNGNFTNRQVEATPGFVINQIANSSSATVPKFLPNLVLLDAGTNNCNGGGTVPDAGASVSSLIGSIYAQSPGSTVILASVLVNKVPAQEACRVDINSQYNALAAQLTGQGAKFVFVDMRGPDGPTVNDLADTRHPNDAGYVKMANVWMQGIQQVLAKGFITPPVANGVAAGGVA